MSEKIKILFLSANPSDTSHIAVDREAREILEKLEQGSARDAFEVIQYPAVRPSDLPRLLMKYHPHIVHFSGHGSRAKKIVMESDLGESQRIKTEALVDVFRVFKDDVRVIVLNACFTMHQAVALTEVIDYAVGISRAIGDEAAIKFAGAFYLGLSFRMPVLKAFETAKADLRLNSVRRSKGLEIICRDGLDKSVVFPPPDEERLRAERETLKAALRQVSDAVSTEEETSLVRRATLNGSLVLAHTEDAAGGELIIAEANGGATTGQELRVELDTSSYRRIQERLFPPPPGISPPLPGLIVVGREDSLTKVKGLLQAPGTAEPDLNLTVVRGWPGVGKTTLVGLVGRDPDVLKAFPHGVLWTSLERRPELMTKLAEWGRALGNDEFLRATTLDEAVLKLALILRHKRMLLIVDDIWDKVHALPFLKAATGSQCALLATTRLTEVAEALIEVGLRDELRKDERIHVLPVLSEENALVLLHYLAPSIVEQYPDECRELVSDLGYLPLALQVVGRLLKAEAKMGLSIVNLIEGIREGAKLLPEPAPLDRAEGTTLPTVHALLKRSTDGLDELTRNCFAYLGPFAPKPATFDFAAMRAVWQIDDPSPVIRKLVGHGLLEPVGTDRFQMHELLVQHARALLQG